VFLDEMLKRIDSGLLTEAALDDRLARFNRFKKRALSMPAVDNVQLRARAALATADHVVVAGVQLLRDRQGWLPISRPGTKRILHVRIALAHSVMHPVVDQFQTALREVFASVESIADPGPDRLRELTESGAHDALIVSVLNEYGYGVNHIHLAGPIARNMMGGWMHLGKPVIFISHAHPYLHCEYQAAMNCVIRTCGTVEATIPRLIEIIAREGAQVVADEVG
jgi:beta-N-acetylhexosaminidase